MLSGGERLASSRRGLRAPPRREVSASARDYEAAYRRGRADNTIALALTGTIEDIVAFDADDTHRLQIGGTVDFRWLKHGIRCHATVSGHADFFVPPAFLSFKGKDRIMVYDVTFRDDAGDPWHVLGFKRMHADEGARAWADTTNLFVTITCAPKDLVTIGVARLAMETFLYDVLGKMRVTGTEDPARKVWALAAYGELLFGHLWEIYGPHVLQSRGLVASSPLSRRP